MRISYNAPFTLTFTFFCIGIRLLGDTFTASLFTVYPSFDYHIPVDYLRLVSHAAGHSGWTHLIGNFSLILILGPVLEEKYSSMHLALMALVTALVTGIIHVLFSSSGLLGASGIVFMMILLASFGNMKSGKIPLTFLLVLILYLGQEFYSVGKNDQVAHYAHIIGGLCGGVFGFMFYTPKGE
jgi:membrane associated rhomboid family serine protease